MRALIVDDEPLARTAIRNMLRHHPDIEIAGECEGGAEAVTAIPRLAPDLVFLDVEMPEVDGFGVLEARGISRPHVVFVTAYHQYAVRAFEVHALDYLLKPFDRERFDPTLDRARRHASQPPANRLEHSIVRQAGRAFFTRSTAPRIPIDIMPLSTLPSISTRWPSRRTSGPAPSRSYTSPSSAWSSHRPPSRSERFTVPRYLDITSSVFRLQATSFGDERGQHAPFRIGGSRQVPEVAT